MKVVGKRCIIGWKIHFLRYSIGELRMISGLFFCKPFVKILIFRFTKSISRFRITRNFTGNFPRNFPKIFRKFLGKFLTPHLPPLPTPHIIHPHPTPKTLNPLRTLNPLFSKSHLLLDYVSFSHHFHVCMLYVCMYVMYVCIVGIYVV